MKAVLAPILLCFVLFVHAGVASAQEESVAWYEADEVPASQVEGVNRRTPRESVRSFVALTDDGQYQAAAAFLNLSDLSAEDRATRGPVLARQLGLVIDRQLWIDWTKLSARPDAMLETSSGQHPLAGQPRRDIGLKLVTLDGQAYEIRLARYKAPGADPVWLFTPQTMQNVPKLFDAFGPRAFERWLPEALKQRIGALRIWEWIALPLLVGLLVSVGLATNGLIRWVQRRSGRDIVKQSLDKVRIPLALVVSAIAAQFLLQLVVSFSGPATNIARPILIIFIVAGLGITALKVIDVILDRVTLRMIGEIDDTRSLDQRELYTSIYALRRIVVLVMVGVAIVVVLSRLNLFDSLGMTLLASAGVVTVLLGIAGQAVLGNIMASLQIALAKPVRIGDSVVFDGEWAYVESIFYTFMRLRTWDERRIIVPVRYFVSQPFENWSVKDARTMKTITIVLDHKAELAPLREVFFDLARKDDGVIEPESLLAHVTDHTAQGQEMSFFAMFPDPSTAWVGAMRLREALLEHIRRDHPDWWPRDRMMWDGAAPPPAQED